MKIQLELFRYMLLSDDFTDISKDLAIFDDEKCTFYYDESNNIRKLWLDENGFNAPIDRDFILGGVMHFGENCSADIDDLKNQLRIQKSAKEIKFKHISKSKDFLGCLSENKVSIFLEWLFKSDLYVHYSNVNNLYYAIVDIIDTINEPAYIHFNVQMKNELYKIAKDNYKLFYKLLNSCNYPNINTNKIECFYSSIIDFIVNSKYELSLEVEILLQLLKVAQEKKELVLLQGNPDKTVIDSYFQFYIRPIGTFPYATHIFDNEYKIQGQFSKYDFYYGDNICKNFDFINSKSNLFVQISDCIVGLLGKYYTYINSIDINEAYKMINTITPKQKKSLKIFVNLLYKSENKSKLLLHSVESREQHDVSSFIVNNIL